MRYFFDATGANVSATAAAIRAPQKLVIAELYTLHWVNPNAAQFYFRFFAGSYIPDATLLTSASYPVAIDFRAHALYARHEVPT